MKSFFTILAISTLFAAVSLSKESEKKNVQTDKQELQRTSLSISFAQSGNSFSFNVPDSYIAGFSFKNRTGKENTVTRRSYLKEPLLIYYSSILMVPNGEPLYRIYPVLLNPGDSVVLKEGADGSLLMKYSTGFPNFIDSLIPIVKDLTSFDLKKQQNLKKAKGIAAVLENIEAFSRKNEELINHLKLSEKHKYQLGMLNGNLKYTALAHLLSEPGLPVKFTDSIYTTVLNHIDSLGSIDGLPKSAIIEEMITYSAKKQDDNLGTNNVWSRAAAADQELKQKKAYKKYLTLYVSGNFASQPNEILVINKNLERVYKKDPFLDTLYQLTSILSRTFINFPAAKANLKTFAGGRFNFIIENDESSANHEMKTIRDLPAIALYDFQGMKSELKPVLISPKYKLTVVDLWASWCIPCIAEIPKWKIIEERFKGKPVRFLTISIDKKEDIDKWVEVAKRNGVYNKPNQYRLADFKESPFTRLFNVRNIPRYLLFDNKGNVLDEDFLRPSAGSFELELLKYLNR